MSNGLVWKWVIGLGVVTWMVPFIISFTIYPIHVSNRPLFESIMPNLILIITCLSMIILSTKNTKLDTLRGLEVGLIWMIINLILDLALFLPPSPMQMSVVDYFYDIGITYFIIPIAATTIGFMSSHTR